MNVLILQYQVLCVLYNIWYTYPVPGIWIIKYPSIFEQSGAPYYTAKLTHPCSLQNAVIFSLQMTPTHPSILNTPQRRTKSASTPPSIYCLAGEFWKKKKACRFVLGDMRPIFFRISPSDRCRPPSERREFRKAQAPRIIKWYGLGAVKRYV